MALPLKSGADLYNNQALRLRLHNLGADPTEVGAGLIYFNTSTGLNTSQKARLYTGSAWKTIAFSEDLDVASNADFLALKERVDLLSGDVDTDAIISNMKEVSEFLAGFAEDASLMDLLNGKLNKDGGKAKNLAIVGSGTSYLAFESTDGTSYGSIGVSSGHEAKFWDGAGAYTLLHSGNVGEYALKTDGSNAMKGGVKFDTFNIDLNVAKGDGIRIIDRSGLNGPNTSTYWNTLSVVGGNGGFQLSTWANAENDNLFFRHVANDGTTWSAWKTIAFMDSNVASATKLETPRTIWGQSFDGTGNVSGALHLGTGTIRSSKSGTDLVFLDFGSQGDPYIGYGMAGAGIDSHLCGNTIYLHYGTSRANGFILNSSGNVTIGDSDLAGTDCKLSVDGGVTLTSLVTTGTITKIKELGNKGLYLANSAKRNGYGVAMWVESNGYGHIQAQGYTDEAKTYPLTLNPFGGNVLIGTTNDNGAKLYVNGLTKAGALELGNIITLNRGFNSGAVLDSTKSALKIETYPSYVGFNVYTSGGTARTNTLVLSDGGNVGIGTTDPDEKLHVVGNLHVTGNIIADGEVSAGGAAEEGGNAGGGGGAFYSDIIKKGATQTTIAHGLGTDDIVVSIYEKDGVSGRWSIILTDVEIVDANNIIVSFGSATTVEHKVVIMGAVA